MHKLKSIIEIINQYAFDHDLYCEFTDASDLTDSEIPESISHYNCWDTNDFLYSTLRIHRSIERSRNAAQIGELEKITEFPAPGESGIIPVSVQLYPKVKP